MNSILAETAPASAVDEKLLELSSEIDGFECYTGPHAERIASIADKLAAAFNLASQDRFLLHQAALIHDIGELKMGRDYISAPRQLFDSERIDLQRHPVIGEQAAAKLALPRGVQLLVRWHHEWWSGDGYPDKLTGEQIPLSARILRVADSFAALTAARPFRDALTDTEARRHMSDWAGIEFDPAVVKALLSTPLPISVTAETDPFAEPATNI